MRVERVVSCGGSVFLDRVTVWNVTYGVGFAKEKRGFFEAVVCCGCRGEV